jgi:hypothetical protein
MIQQQLLHSRQQRGRAVQGARVVAGAEKIVPLESKLAQRFVAGGQRSPGPIDGHDGAFDIQHTSGQWDHLERRAHERGIATHQVMRDDVG